MSFLRYRFPINYTYSINGSSVSSVFSKKDLGIIFNYDLNFHSHTEMICCKALKTLGFVMRIQLIGPFTIRVFIGPMGPLYGI
jgi:hypothetical protein